MDMKSAMANSLRKCLFVATLLAFTGVQGWVATSSTPRSSILVYSRQLGPHNLVVATTPLTTVLGRPMTATRGLIRLLARHENRSNEPLVITVEANRPQSNFGTLLATATLCSMLTWNSPLLTSSPAAHAYDASDYASETVQAALKSIQDASGKAEETVKAFENVAAIITEGKGVGGEINYKGVQLDRGYVSDEDTGIYNPGLTLLTESEKERLVEAIVESRKAASRMNSADAWTADTQAGFDFLRGSLDPLHMYELRGYLGVVPFYGAALYLTVLAVQQLARPAFAAAYVVGIVALVLPAVAIVLLGPQ
jgi:hypothetical protein